MQTPDPPFDPYHIWLAIPPDQRPPDLYQLLGLQPFESDVNVITNAVDQRMRHVKSFAAGPHGNLSQRILNELSQAKVHLINPQMRAAYDAQLRGGRGVGIPRAIPTAVPLAAPVQQAKPLVQPVTAQPAATFETQPATSSSIPGFALKTEDRSRRRNKPSSAVMAVVYLAVAGIASVLIWIFAFGNPTFESTAKTPTTSTEPAEEVQTLVEPELEPPADPTPPATPAPSDSSTDSTEPAPREPDTEPLPIEYPKTDPAPTADPPQSVTPAEAPPVSPPEKDVNALEAAIGMSESPIDTSPREKKEPVPLPAKFDRYLGTSFRNLSEYDYATYHKQRTHLQKVAFQSQDESAISAVNELEQMERAFAKVWELVHIAIEPLQAMEEIQSPGGGTAAVIESAPDRLILRVNGESRRYFAERRGPMKVFPSMTGDLATLLANRVESKSPQGEKAIAFVKQLMASDLPDDDEALWKVAREVWASDGAPPPKFFGIPAIPSDVVQTPVFGTDAAPKPVPVPVPNADPGYHVARFHFDGTSSSTEIKVPPAIASNPRLEISRIYLGSTLGVHTPSRSQREIENGTWQCTGQYVKLIVRTKASGDTIQADLTGQYRRDSGSRFRFEPISLRKIEEQGDNIVNALTKKRIDVSGLVRQALASGKPLDLLDAPSDANLQTIMNGLGKMPAVVDPSVAIIIRMRQISDFATELQEEGWVELKWAAE